MEIQRHGTDAKHSRSKGTIRKLILAVVLLALAPGSGFAQSQTDFWTNLAQLKVGKKVQVVDSNLNKVKGRLLDVSGDAITLEVEDEEVVIPRWKVTLVSVKHSKAKQVLRGFLSGAVVAAPALLNPSTIYQIAYGGRGGTIAAIMIGAGTGVLGLAEALEVNSF